MVLANHPAYRRIELDKLTVQRMRVTEVDLRGEGHPRGHDKEGSRQGHQHKALIIHL